jgi:hypothetical protein
MGAHCHPRLVLVPIEFLSWVTNRGCYKQRVLSGVAMMNEWNTVQSIYHATKIMFLRGAAGTGI